MRSTFLLLGLAAILALLAFSGLQAQRVEDPTFEIDKEVQRIYGTQAYLRDKGIVCTGSGTAYPVRDDIKELIKEIEGRVAEVQNAIKIEPLKIGLVFHFLNTKDPQEANKKVKQQLEALNRDFNNKAWVRQHPNDPEGVYLKLAASAHVTFELAKVENTAYGEGIPTLILSDTQWKTWDDVKIPDKGGAEAINPSQYINIWIADLPDHLSSYATSPYVIDELDGIVMDGKYLQFEDARHNYNQGKTLTHLIGNYLGLNPLWGTGGRCSDDGVGDTPVHNDPNYGCPGYMHLSFCKNNPVEMTMNYMDSSDDACQMMFTKGQVQRMHAMIQVSRTGLWKNNKTAAQ